MDRFAEADHDDLLSADFCVVPAPMAGEFLENLVFLEVGLDQAILAWKYPLERIQPPLYFKATFQIDCQILKRGCYNISLFDNNNPEIVKNPLAFCWLKPVAFEGSRFNEWQQLMQAIHAIVARHFVSWPLNSPDDNHQTSCADQLPIYNSRGNHCPATLLDNVPFSKPVSVIFTLWRAPGIHNRSMVGARFYSIRKISVKATPYAKLTEVQLSNRQQSQEQQYKD
ncbi:hypothetical protein SERLA73DRAFT_74078 [Serpula lacrymans var. lacrymans S7.3]|uniref:Uncharacterized protein n=2 Tax=Serpula lacrymans var. lacrymans TaxID=341189 RepID=F8Q0I4_SERL3|nr:uncharacterized protein SERLADRAFT_438716 [Serpula lacrymans var. lacrymans S7.9]EGN97813.1 hypothetical protein SERLA73DRAFT_74078 [Serpula lacrymans var. lacrymans S7.3]EGO23405.1 hypothetical protein SERLADRAFT_438716 [Serpula lacrymans var. lacrymans S7.9]